MISEDEARRLADELHTARRDVTTVRQISLRHPEMTVVDAYAVQQSLVARMLAEGRTVVGRKVGLTSMPMQRSMGISEPDYGVITDDMVFPSGGEIEATRFNYPRVEIELAFILADRIEGPGVTAGDVLRATSHISPSIEILDSRIEMTDAATGHRRTIVDTVSDNAADAGMVLGPGILDPSDFRPRDLSALLYINGIIEETGVASAVLGHPAQAVAWLANKLGEYGQALESGQVVLSGSLTQSVPVRAGDVVHGDFGGMGAVTCRFV